MKRKSTKLMAIIICAIMLAALLPTGAFAAENVVVPGAVCEISGVQFSDFTDALAAVKNGETIKLLADINYNSGIEIDGISVTFDLDSQHTLNVTNARGDGLAVINGGEVKLEGEILGTAEFNVVGTYYMGAPQTAGVYANGIGVSAAVSNATCVGAYGNGAYAENEAIIKVTGNAWGGDNGSGVDARTRAFVEVLGNAGRSGALESTSEVVSVIYGVYARTGATVKVYGNILYARGYCLIARDEDTSVFVGGSVIVGGINSSSTGYGIWAMDGAIVEVMGDVETISDSGVGVRVQGVNSEVIINGTIATPVGGVYIMLSSEVITINDFEAVSSKPGYFEYTDGSNYIWVKDPAYVPVDDANYTVLDAALAAAAELKEADYTAASWAVLAAAVADGEAVDRNLTVLDQNLIDDAAAVILSAIDGLVPAEKGPEKPMKDKLNDAIANGDYYGTGPITVIVDGVEYVFVSNSGNYNGNGTLFCTIDGVEYKLDRNAHGIKGVKN